MKKVIFASVYIPREYVTNDSMIQFVYKILPRSLPRMHKFITVV